MIELLFDIWLIVAGVITGVVAILMARRYVWPLV